MASAPKSSATPSFVLAMPPMPPEKNAKSTSCTSQTHRLPYVRGGEFACRHGVRGVHGNWWVQEKIETIAKEMYGADGVTFTDKAKKKLDLYTKLVRLAVGWWT